MMNPSTNPAPTPEPEQINLLVSSIDGLSTEVVALRGDIADEQTERKRAVRTGKTAIGLAMIVAVVSLLAGLTGIFYGVTANQNADAIVAQRKEARTAACVQDNIRIEQHNTLTEAMRDIINLTNVPNPNRTPAQQAALDAFLAKSYAALDTAVVPLRDCTDRGVDAYYTTTTTTVPVPGTE